MFTISSGAKAACASLLSPGRHPPCECVHSLDGLTGDTVLAYIVKKGRADATMLTRHYQSADNCAMQLLCKPNIYLERKVPLTYHY